MSFGLSMIHKILYSKMFFFYIITKYNFILYDKFIYYIFFLNNEAYILEIIMTTHPQYYLEVF